MSSNARAAASLTASHVHSHEWHESSKSAKNAMISWMHNTATTINDISRKYNHRGHRGAQRIGLKTLCSLVSSVVKSGGFYRLCGIDLTTTKSVENTRIFRQCLLWLRLLGGVNFPLHPPDLSSQPLLWLQSAPLRQPDRASAKAPCKSVYQWIRCLRIADPTDRFGSPALYPPVLIHEHFDQRFDRS